MAAPEAFTAKGKHKLYGGNVYEGIGLQLPGWNYPVVINTETGLASYDNFNGSWGKEIELDINGKVFKLDSNSLRLLLVNPKGGWSVLDKIFGADKGQYYYGGSKKDITRSRNGKQVLTWLADKLTTEPKELRDLLTQAASQMK